MVGVLAVVYRLRGEVPAVPVHTWLPDAHVRSADAISMILAGVLLKMAATASFAFAIRSVQRRLRSGYFVCTIGVLSMVYGAFAAMAQKDFKRLVALQFRRHMGYVTLGWAFGVR